jgi:hypothetical protein
MGPTALLLFRKKGVLMIFIFALKKSDGFGRVRTRERWVLKASTLPLEHRRRFGWMLLEALVAITMDFTD